MRMTWVCFYFLPIFYHCYSTLNVVFLNSLIVSAGERNLPAARLEEIIFVLQELARLKIHPDTASALPLHPVLKSGLAMDENSDKRPHLLVLFPSFCELVISR